MNEELNELLEIRPPSPGSDAEGKVNVDPPSIFAIVFGVLSCCTFLFAAVHVAGNWREWGGFSWLNPGSMVFIFVALMLGCAVILVVAVFFGNRLTLKGSKYRVIFVWLVPLAYAAIYAFAPGWYKPAGGGWSITSVSTNKTGFEYLLTITFDPDFRLSPLIFTALATAFGIAAVFFTKIPPKPKGKKTNLKIEIPDFE